MKCERCGTKENLTRDHIIPKRVYKISDQLVPSFKRTLGQRNIQTLCKECNSRKGMSIDVSHPVGLNFWLDLRKEIDKAINKQFS